jgi:hypothetical protein
MRVRPVLPRASHPAYTTLTAYHSVLARTNHARWKAYAASGPPYLSDDAPPQVVVYQPAVRDRSGYLLQVPLDRQLRGLYFAFILSFCLERWLLVDVDELHSLYGPPHNVSWVWGQYTEVLTALPSMIVNSSHVSLLRSTDLQKRWIAPVLFYRELT